MAEKPRSQIWTEFSILSLYIVTQQSSCTAGTPPKMKMGIFRGFGTASFLPLATPQKTVNRNWW